MTSKIQICNRALSAYLGASRINSLTEDNSRAKECNLHYDDVLQTVFETYDWTFARGRQILAETENDRENEWAYKYIRPASALTIQWVNVGETARYLIDRGESPDTPREVFGEYVYSDVGYAACQFTKLISDPSSYPAYFANLVSAALAANICLALTENIKKAEFAYQQYERLIDQAIMLDSANEYPVKHKSIPHHLKLRGL
ncbi:hypothetical protein [uncultured Cohaesibacter sp.]|uniref:hypothetical protein n=1 Tax=uncultured Cohaesibacter sp. TaxID=1002546 RepID=UPI0029307430|nr:hypothetical protein [uncultured Cohaesibacter sp.]